MEGTLVIRPLSANLTRDTDLFTKMDPYIIFTIGNEKAKTKICHGGGKHPIWNETVLLKKHPNDTVLSCEIWDFDLNSPDDYVAHGQVNLSNLHLKQHFSESVDLVYKLKPVGNLMLDITFQPSSVTLQSNYPQPLYSPTLVQPPVGPVWQPSFQVQPPITQPTYYQAPTVQPSAYQNTQPQSSYAQPLVYQPQPIPYPNMQGVYQPAIQPTMYPQQPINQPINQQPPGFYQPLTNQPTYQLPTNPSIYQPMNQPGYQQLANQYPYQLPTNLPVYQPGNQPVYQPVNQPSYQPINQQPIYQPMPGQPLSKKQQIGYSGFEYPY